MKFIAPVFIGAAFALTACATDGEREPSGFAALADDPRLGASVSSACYGFNLDGFRETTRDTVIIEGRGRQEYLLTTRACFNLRDAFQLGIDGRGGCASRGDRLIVSDSGVPAQIEPTGLESCIITGVYEWNEKAGASETDEEAKTEN